ncbi:LPS export ABC transporter periplasmic protein LptC [Roseovarius gahaiensis]|uniref:LPS export ABC transporter periplasmic protein LptC n=1 Tax=Roseovarius gahaiensis TaxID=2716691 RepID=A0A967BB76_9RHOB|nr:LPS export ABC transporter periplasmic protein LptC [Roseovarius gahaiensis]NHQ73094.1 LPS export ABC transporter periplasmic protein LptC [Roseovarius gahaiensis]
MARHNNLQSKLVAWMKIILPLAALGLLSTLFLLSRTVDPTRSVPVSQIDIEKRAAEQGASNPTFSGVTEEGDQVTVRARSAVPNTDDMSKVHAEQINATLELQSGSKFNITSQSAKVDSTAFTVQLIGDVRIVSSTGFDLETEVLNARFDVLYTDTPGPVSGSGPPGNLQAGRMVLRNDDSTDAAHLLFTDGVKLIYQPQNPKD